MFTILDDGIVEGMEALNGNIEGIINSLNALETDPDRITFQPRDTTLNILDTDSEFNYASVRVVMIMVGASDGVYRGDYVGR